MMNTQLRSASHRRRIGTQYYRKVLRHGPIAYWPLWEASGSVAHELVNGWDGAYTGVTLGRAGIGDRNVCPLFDGVGDYVNIYTTALRDAFDKAEGTLMIWARVFNVGVWTDTTKRDAAAMQADGTNYIQLRKRQWTTSQWSRMYDANGTLEYVVRSPMSDTSWYHTVMTWSVSANQMKAYHNGTQDGTTQTGLGTWIGTLSATKTVIGAQDTDPSFPWYGWLAHCAIWDTPLTPAQVADLAVV